jgi:hypothetical protein
VGVTDVHMGVAVCLTPVGCCSIELVRSKKDFLVIHALDDHEFLLNSFEPMFSFHWVLGLGECGRVSLQELHQMRLVWWWRCLSLVSLLLGLHIVEGLQHSLHKLILGGDELFMVDIVVGVVVVIAGLAIALAIPCVHHLMVW